jgi:catechol 2,3-dioxygenase-like lactoylglutathione lyase family enzyme
VLKMEAKTKARAVGINHVALEVDDVDAALEFYGALFDLKLRGRHGGMAFIDLGDQFINLSPKRTQSPDGARHFGLVVDDRQAVRRALEKLGVEILPGPGLDFLDPWGNHLQVVQYDGIQFTKAEPVLRGMGLEGLGKTPEAIRELEEKGMAPQGRS